jgi:tetratricopeptide (TPR) repeat protein
LPPASGAEEAARKAIELDPTLSDPHAALGFIRLIHNWDWAGAELELRRARELNPRDATALQWYALYLSLRGRHSEAIAELRRALSLEPASARLHDDLCYVLYFARQYDQAIDQCQNAATIASNRIGTQRALYLIYSKQGHYQQALAAFPAQTRAPLLEKAFAKEGMRGFWKALADITISDRLNSSRAYFIAETYSLMGDTDLALSWLETAADQHNFFMPWIGVNPAFDVLRPHPRFQALLHRVGLK